MYHYVKSISYTPRSNDEIKIKEELDFLAEQGYQMIRLIDDVNTSRQIVEVIVKHHINLEVFLGIKFSPELIDQEAPLEKIIKTKDVILNKRSNQQKVTELISLANQYEEIISYVSVGYLNISSFDYHMISVVELSKYLKMVKPKIKQPLTYSDSFYLWNTKLKELANLVDFIGIHVHPYYQEKFLSEAVDYTVLVLEASQENFNDKPVVLTETGYPRVNKEKLHITEEQRFYVDTIQQVMKEKNILVTIYEAFDSIDRLNPYLEKHGLYE